MGVAQPDGAPGGGAAAERVGAALAPAASQALTAAADAPRAVALSRCFQPSCFSRRACLRRHSLKSGPESGSVVMNHCLPVYKPMATGA